MTTKKEDCFIIMPISDPAGYENGHFHHVYNDIISPACDIAGFKPIRADDVLETNMIHLDVLKKLLDTPMAICDLSTSNPNVLFELGLRQAFDKPVVLIQEQNTPKIFDIAPLRFTEYRKELVYHQVLEDQKNISLAIEATKNAIGKGSGINSIVKLLSLTSSATFMDFNKEESNPLLQVVLAEMEAMRREFNTSLKNISAISGVPIYQVPLFERSFDASIQSYKNKLTDLENKLKFEKGSMIFSEIIQQFDDIINGLVPVVNSPDYPEASRYEAESIRDRAFTLKNYYKGRDKAFQNIKNKNKNVSHGFNL